MGLFVPSKKGWLRVTDVLTRSQRSFNMAQIKGRNTRPEMAVRSFLHSLGYRYRLHARDLPGSPDIVLPKHGAIIFVHGCFWHIHRCRYGKVIPATNAEFWQNKRTGNIQRDRRNVLALRKAGWRVLTVWECWTKRPDYLHRQLCTFLERRTS